MIGKNEEDNLHRCLKSVKPIADLIVYADTGSTDSSVSIAESHGCEIRHVEFQDFAQARNTAKLDLPGDWILQIDGDEMLCNPYNIHKYCESNDFEAYLFHQEHLILGGNSSAIGMRLFRNRPHYKYVGCIHEMPENMLATGDDMAIAPFALIEDMCFAHFGCIDEKMRRSKVSNRNLDLLIKDLSVNPTRTYNKYLAIRDLLNIYKWRTESVGYHCKDGSREHKLLCAIITVYNEFRGVWLDRHLGLARETSNTAQSLLSQQNLDYHKVQVDLISLLNLGLT
jgi:glycosyltransferase involved in cell wall biosynthesis